MLLILNLHINIHLLVSTLEIALYPFFSSKMHKEILRGKNHRVIKFAYFFSRLNEEKIYGMFLFELFLEF